MQQYCIYMLYFCNFVAMIRKDALILYSGRKLQILHCCFSYIDSKALLKLLK